MVRVCRMKLGGLDLDGGPKLNVPDLALAFKALCMYFMTLSVGLVN